MYMANIGTAGTESTSKGVELDTDAVEAAVKEMKRIQDMCPFRAMIKKANGGTPEEGYLVILPLSWKKKFLNNHEERTEKEVLAVLPKFVHFSAVIGKQPIVVLKPEGLSLNFPTLK